ncbi:MAG: ArsR/SmtB family transcription factor [Spirochaetota bacterium]
MNQKKQDDSLYISQLKALADEIRIQIVQLLSSGPLCACDLQASFHISQPTLSYHLKQLTDSGIIIAEREGRWMHYSLNQKSVHALVNFITFSASVDNGVEPKQRSRCT